MARPGGVKLDFAATLGICPLLETDSRGVDRRETVQVVTKVIGVLSPGVTAMTKIPKSVYGS